MTDPNVSYEVPLLLEKLSQVDATTQKMDLARATGAHQWVKGAFPTPIGVVKILHQKMLDGTVKTTVDAPEGALIHH